MWDAMFVGIGTMSRRDEGLVAVIARFVPVLLMRLFFSLCFCCHCVGFVMVVAEVLLLSLVALLCWSLH